MVNPLRWMSPENAFSAHSCPFVTLCTPFFTPEAPPPGIVFRSTTRNRYVSILFFNQRTRLVDDVIEGTIVASPWNNLARLESDPAIRVVVRRDLNKSNVAIISGGGSGHERPTLVYR